MPSTRASSCSGRGPLAWENRASPERPERSRAGGGARRKDIGGPAKDRTSRATTEVPSDADGRRRPGVEQLPSGGVPDRARGGRRGAHRLRRRGALPDDRPARGGALRRGAGGARRERRGRRCSRRSRGPARSRRRFLQAAAADAPLGRAGVGGGRRRAQARDRARCSARASPSRATAGLPGGVVFVRDVTRERAAERRRGSSRRASPSSRPSTPSRACSTSVASARSSTASTAAARAPGTATRSCASTSTAWAPSTRSSASRWATRCSSRSPGRLKKCLREYDVVARLEDDEFAVLLPGADVLAARDGGRPRDEGDGREVVRAGARAQGHALHRRARSGCRRRARPARTSSGARASRCARPASRAERACTSRAGRAHPMTGRWLRAGVVGLVRRCRAPRSDRSRAGWGRLSRAAVTRSRADRVASGTPRTLR